MLGSVLPSLKPGCSMSVNRSFSGLLPDLIALNSDAYLLFGLYATTIDVPAYWVYHLVNLGNSGVTLSPPTLSKTFGWISPLAISDSRVPDGAPIPLYLYPSAFVNAGPTTFSFRNCNDAAYATFTVPE